MKTRVFLVDQHQALHRSVAALVNSQEDLEYCGGTDSPAMAMESIVADRADVVLVDAAQLDKEGLRLLRDVRARAPRVAVIILSISADSCRGLKSLEAGARGFVSKFDAPSHLLATIRHVRAGRLHRSGALQNLVRAGRPRRASTSPVNRPLLTELEKTVMHYVAEGRTSAEMSNILSLGYRDIALLRATLKRKLCATSAIDLVRFCAMGARAAESIVTAVPLLSPRWPLGLPPLEPKSEKGSCCLTLHL